MKVKFTVVYSYMYMGKLGQIHSILPPFSHPSSIPLDTLALLH